METAIPADGDIEKAVIRLFATDVLPVILGGQILTDGVDFRLKL